MDEQGNAGTSPESEYKKLLARLLSHQHIFFSSPSSPHALLIAQKSQSNVATISSLSLHPTLESILHILNGDLPSAHFLLRHAQSKPAWEMMYLHGILHRIEGDIDNARAWYGDVEDQEVLKTVWNQMRTEDEAADVTTRWKAFLSRVERWRDSIKARNGSKGQLSKDGAYAGIDWGKEEQELRDQSLEEIKKVLEFCENKFGTGHIKDASSIWIQESQKHGGKIKDIKSDMIVGGEGWRKF